MALPRLKPPPALIDDPARADHLAQMLRAVAHPLRLRLIAILCESPTDVTTMAERTGAAQAIVSQQLGILRMSRLVAAERSGGRAVYRLLEPRLRNLISCVEGCQT